MLAAIWDAHVMDLGCAVCGSSSWSPTQEVTGDRHARCHFKLKWFVNTVVLVTTGISKIFVTRALEQNHMTDDRLKYRFGSEVKPVLQTTCMKNHLLDEWLIIFVQVALSRFHSIIQYYTHEIIPYPRTYTRRAFPARLGWKRGMRAIAIHVLHWVTPDFKMIFYPNKGNARCPELSVYARGYGIMQWKLENSDNWYLSTSSHMSTNPGNLYKHISPEARKLWQLI